MLFILSNPNGSLRILIFLFSTYIVYMCNILLCFFECGYIFLRQLNGLKLENAHMDGFLSYLQNETKQKIIKEDSHLHVYSSDDVEM